MLWVPSCRERRLNPLPLSCRERRLNPLPLVFTRYRCRSTTLFSVAVKYTHFSLRSTPRKLSTNQSPWVSCFTKFPW